MCIDIHMPAQRPRASFEPIAPDFDLRELVENTENFQYVDRISVDTIAEQGIEQFERLVLLHVVIGGKPLVIDGYEDRLDPWIFTEKWLHDNHGDKVENARNLTTKDNIPLTIGHYLRNMRKLTDQFFEKPDNYRDKNRQRVYLKDIDCPPVWQDKVCDHIPPTLFYWNDSTGDVGGPGSVDEPVPAGSGRRKGRGIAPAGDLMSSLPLEMRAENLMCYIGHEGTYTPAHREMCASLGHNIMVEASESFDENGEPVKPGHSIWFMTESKDRHMVSEYWLSVLGHDIEVENHFAQIAAWQKAPFKTYVVEQRPGDFILIPPLAPHQVWNRGTRTMKVAWNRTTVETLEMAFREALPNSRIVCRDEQYKNKAIVYYTLLKYSALLKRGRTYANHGPVQTQDIYTSKKVRQVQKDFKRLFGLFKEIMLSEMFVPETKEHCEFLAFDGNVTCAYCRGNIFNRFLTCKTCADALGAGTEEPYDICMDCFAMGRSCACQSKYKWAEQFKWKELATRYEEWRNQIIEIDGGVTVKTPLPLAEERKRFPRKTTAQICQEQLKIRPWRDIKKPEPVEEEEDEEIIVNDDGTIKKVVKKKPKDWHNMKTCHMCLKRHHKWMMAHCTMCERGWCYGSLWRAFDLMPQTIMENPSWECPHCLRICSTGACRKDPRQVPYEPKGTVLGHDTKKVADARSIELLVDFSTSNMNWIKDIDAPHDSVRMQRKREEAEREKNMEARLDDDEDMAGEGVVAHAPPANEGLEIEYDPMDENIDPALGGRGVRALFHDQDASMVVDANLMDSEESFAAPTTFAYNHEPLHESFTRSPSESSRKRLAPDAEPIKLVEYPKKRTKVVDGAEIERPTGPKSKATAQWKKEQENKRLEEARKQGRFIMVLASMRGRRKVVTLKLKTEILAELAAKEVRQRPSIIRANARAMAEETAIIRSDIAPPKKITAADEVEGKKRKVFRYRAEDDEDFSVNRLGEVEEQFIRRRGKKSKRQKFEYVEVDSDAERDEVAAPTTSRRRGESIELIMLPDDFKDGDVSRSRRVTIPGRPIGRPSERTMIWPARASKGEIGGDAADDEDGNQGIIERLPPILQGAAKRGHERKQRELEQQAGRKSDAGRAVELAKAAVMEEENRRAKLEAAGILEGVVDDIVRDIENADLPITIPPDEGTPTNVDGSNGDSTNALKQQKKKVGPGALRAMGLSVKVARKATNRPSLEKKVDTVEVSDGESSDASDTENEMPAKVTPTKTKQVVAGEKGVLPGRKSLR